MLRYLAFLFIFSIACCKNSGDSVVKIDGAEFSYPKGYQKLSIDTTKHEIIKLKYDDHITLTAYQKDFKFSTASSKTYCQQMENSILLNSEKTKRKRKGFDPTSNRISTKYGYKYKASRYKVNEDDKKNYYEDGILKVGETCFRFYIKGQRKYRAPNDTKILEILNGFKLKNN